MSIDETASPDPAPPDNTPPRKQGSLFRIVLFSFLVIAVVALGFDKRADWAAQGLFNTLDPLNKSTEKPTKEAVHAKIGGTKPAKSYDAPKVNKRVEEYHYQSSLPWRKYIVYVYYSMVPTQPDRFYSVTLNTPEEF